MHRGNNNINNIIINNKRGLMGDLCILRIKRVKETDFKRFVKHGASLKYFKTPHTTKHI